MKRLICWLGIHGRPVFKMEFFPSADAEIITRYTSKVSCPWCGVVHEFRVMKWTGEDFVESVGSPP